MQNILKRNNVNIVGEGQKTIVFGHGFACDQTIWNSILPYFKKDYRIVLYDYVGSGKSDITAFDKNRYNTLHGYSKDLLEILEALNLDKIIFVGHSVSAMIGLLASIKKPELFEAMILIGSSARYLNDEPNYHGGFDERDVQELIEMMEMNFTGWATAAAAIFMNNPDRHSLTENLIKTYTDENPVIMKNFAEATFLSDHRQDLPLVTVPSFIMQCSEDSVVPLQAAQYLQEHLPNNRFVLMNSTGHYPHLSNPEETIMLIKNYIKSVAFNE